MVAYYTRVTLPYAEFFIRMIGTINHLSGWCKHYQKNVGKKNPSCPAKKENNTIEVFPWFIVKSTLIEIKWYQVQFLIQ